MTPAHHHVSNPDDRECAPSFTLERHIASLRRDKSPEELAALYRAWEKNDD